jgi:hypothetical protein
LKTGGEVGVIFDVFRLNKNKTLEPLEEEKIVEEK